MALRFGRQDGGFVSGLLLAATTAFVSGLTTSQGELQAADSTVAGQAARVITASGALQAESAVAAGVAEREIIDVGSTVEISSQSSTVSGEANIGGPLDASGSPKSQRSTVAGTAERELIASGVIATLNSGVSGTAERILPTDGSPASGSSSAAGTAERELTSEGALTAGDSVADGAAQIGNIIVTYDADVQAQPSTVSGQGGIGPNAVGAPKSGRSTVAGVAERTITGSGAVSAQSSTVYGATYGESGYLVAVSVTLEPTLNATPSVIPKLNADIAILKPD